MMLSEHFSSGEFTSHDGVEPPPEVLANIHRLVLGVLEPLRVKWGAPIVVLSGYRTLAWNTKVGGAPNSTHMTGEGADVHPLDPGDLPAFASCVEELRMEGQLPALGGFGKYLRWLHLDIRQVGHLRRWTGRGIGSEQTEAP